MKVIMKSNFGKHHFFLLIGFVIFPLILVDSARSMFEAGFLPASISKWILEIMNIFFLILSISNLTIPWLIYNGVIPFQPTQKFAFVRIDPEYALLLTGYFFLFSPIIFGFVLFYFGMQLIGFYSYVAVTIAVTLAWGIVNFTNLRRRG